MHHNYKWDANSPWVREGQHGKYKKNAHAAGDGLRLYSYTRVASDSAGHGHVKKSIYRRLEERYEKYLCQAFRWVGGATTG